MSFLNTLHGPYGGGISAWLSKEKKRKKRKGEIGRKDILE
jgi:hypothetical protein